MEARDERTRMLWILLLGGLVCGIIALVLMMTNSGVGMAFGVIFLLAAILCVYLRSRIQKAIKAEEEDRERKVQKKEAIRRQVEEAEETEAMRREVLAERKNNFK